MTEVTHHIHKRKRIHQKAETYPASGFKKFLDKFIYLIGVAGPLIAMFQVYKIWNLKNAAGVSEIFCGSLIFFNIIWIVYGLTHKEGPIIFMYSLWLIVNSLIFIGAILY